MLVINIIHGIIDKFFFLFLKLNKLINLKKVIYFLFTSFLLQSK